jgi:hypothetical protein
MAYRLIKQGLPEEMQKLTIKNGFNNKDNSTYKTAKFNIGQNVVVIDWSLKKPVLLNVYILFIGIEHPCQSDDLIYIVDRSLPVENLKKYYENEIYSSQTEAAKFLIKSMKEQTLRLKEMKNHPYFMSTNNE